METNDPEPSICDTHLSANTAGQTHSALDGWKRNDSNGNGATSGRTRVLGFADRNWVLVGVDVT